jgi:hypothetical protein
MAAGAFAGGKAKREVFEEEQAMTNIRQQRQISAAAREAAASRDFAAQQADASRAFSSEQNELSRKSASDQAQAGRDFQQDMAFDSSERAAAAAEENFTRTSGFQARQAVVADQMAKDRYTFELTAKQKAEDDQLAQAQADIQSNDSFTPEQKAEANRLIMQKRAGINPVQMRSATGKTPADDFSASTYTDPKTGVVFAKNPQGGWSSIHEPKTAAENKVASDEAFFKMHDSTYKLLTKKVKGADGVTMEDQFPTEKEVLDHMRKVYKAKDMLIGRQAEGDAGQPEASGDPSTQNATLPDGQPVSLKPVTPQLQAFRDAMKSGKITNKMTPGTPPESAASAAPAQQAAPVPEKMSKGAFAMQYRKKYPDASQEEVFKAVDEARRRGAIR